MRKLEPLRNETTISGISGILLNPCLNILNVAKKNRKEFPRQKNITRQRSSLSLAEDLLVESEVETVGEWRESIWGEIPWGGETNVRGIPPE